MLEPYYGGSHRAFLEGWIARSRHEWTLLTLPAAKWKWRMRHAAATFAARCAELPAAPPPDVLFCSDMLALAEFRGLAPPPLRSLPAVLYFHENQFAYPVRQALERDLHFGWTNFVSALAADAVWFNSDFNRRTFLDGAAELIARMPDHRPESELRALRARCSVQAPGVSIAPRGGGRRPGPVRIAWAARWEHDKNPALLFEAIQRVAREGADVRLSVLGESFRDVPPVFAEMRAALAPQIDHWGYLSARNEYEHVLREADLFVSTARHEFFGLSAAEAGAAGAYLLLPDDLAYPELLAGLPPDERRHHLYDARSSGAAERLASRIGELLRAAEAGRLWSDGPDRVREALRSFAWDVRCVELDAALLAVTHIDPQA